MSIRELMQRPLSETPAIQEGFSRSLGLFQEEMNRLFRDYFNRGGQWAPEFLSPALPAVDVTENNERFTVRAEIPGYDPDKVELNAGEGALTIKGERRQEKEEKGEQYLRHEISSGAFQRTVALPPTANTEKAEASFKNGLLTITVPKKAEALKMNKKIEIRRAA